MSLVDIVDLKETIEFEIKGKKLEIEVRGLSTEDLAVLSSTYDKHLDSLFKGNLDFTKILKEAPEFVAKVIALAADDLKGIDKAARLPFGVQVKALKEIYGLTFPDEEFLGEFINQLIGTLRGLQGKLVLEDAPTSKNETGDETLSKQTST